MVYKRNFFFAIVCLLSYKTVIAANSLCAASAYSDICIKLGEKSYLIDGNAKLNWFEADRFCRRQNGYLATIRNDNEMNAISNYLVSKGYLNGNQAFWLGSNDLGSKGKLYSVETGYLLPYGRWASGQPNTEGSYNCVALIKQNNAFLMSIIAASFKLPYVCELQAIPNASKKMFITYKYA